jgi:chromosome segregation ATPase
MTRWLIGVFILAAILGLGFGNKDIAAADVLRERLGEQLEKTIGKGDIAIKQYENNIQDVKDKLIRVKVARKTYEPKLQAKQTELAKLEDAQAEPERIEAARSIITPMETLLSQLQETETTLETTLKKLVANLDIVKMKIEVLESKIEMMKIQAEIENYSVQESEVQAADSLLSQVIESLNQEIYTLQAQQEAERVIKQVE